MHPRHVRLQHAGPTPEREAVVHQHDARDGAAKVRDEDSHVAQIGVDVAGHRSCENRVESYGRHNVVFEPQQRLARFDEVADSVEAVQRPDQVQRRRAPVLVHVFEPSHVLLQRPELLVDQALVFKSVTARLKVQDLVGGGDGVAHLVRPEIGDLPRGDDVRVHKDVDRVRVPAVLEQPFEHEALKVVRSAVGAHETEEADGDAGGLGGVVGEVLQRAPRLKRPRLKRPRLEPQHQRGAGG
mmetsp:Transcript_2154/g.7866  ORF Transcript_2154/g.7866 Transcript_2154/m.7866 type:complete len:241 (+) Transcript_2154:415-1137(+)